MFTVGHELYFWHACRHNATISLCMYIYCMHVFMYVCVYLFIVNRFLVRETRGALDVTSMKETRGAI